VAAAGIAAHEMGHALQDAKRYTPLVVRSTLVPATQLGSTLGSGMLIGGLILNMFVQSSFGYTIAVVGLALFALTAVFALVTLPVEFDASRRAKELLQTHGVLYGDEMVGVNKVLDSAAWTYVAAAVQAIMTVMYYAFILFGRRD
jgi:Zn-dependent membrane protease YugP